MVKAVMPMYEGAQTVVRTTEGDSKAFNVKVGLHQGSVLIGLEKVSRVLTTEKGFSLKLKGKVKN